MVQQPLGNGAAATPRYLRVLVVVTFLGFFFAAFDTIVPLVSLPLILKDLHLSVADGGIAISVGFIGTFVTGLVIGPVMDRIGRKRSYRLVLLGTALFSGLNALIATLWQFMVIRLVAGSSLGTIETAGVLVAEEAPARRRGLLVGIVQSAFPCGSIAATLIASWLLPLGVWRPLFLVAFLPALVIVVIAGPLLREPSRFTALNQKTSTASQKMQWRAIFSPQLRRQTIAASAFSLLINCGTGFIVTLSVTYLTIYDHLGIGQAALALLLESIGTLIGQLGSGILADYMSPRNVLITFGFLGAISVFLLTIPGPFGWIIIPMLGAGIFGQGILGCLPRYAADSYPTATRGTGASFIIASYWVGVIFMPAIYGALMQGPSPQNAPLIASLVMVCGGIALLFAKKIAPGAELNE